MTQRVFNFSAGPAVLPVPVLEQIQQELLCLPEVGSSILEISHRSPHFDSILESATSGIRSLLSVPENYRILFLQGGSRLQFSMVPMNLLRGLDQKAQYLVTGSWGKKALAEATKEGQADVIWDGADTNYDRLPDSTEGMIDETAAYVHLTSNETIEGVQFVHLPGSDVVPVVCDQSSDFLSRPMDVSRLGLIYACAQKNAGPAGVTVVIIQEDLLARSSDDLPGYLNYRLHAENDSRYNTPATFAIYVLDLVTKWLLNEIGGLASMETINREKAQLLYDVIDRSGGFYRGHAQPDCRSVMNVTFRLTNEVAQKEFLSAAEREQLCGLKGHRSVGGIRASIYNAMSQDGVEALCQFMLDFQRKRG